MGIALLHPSYALSSMGIGLLHHILRATLFRTDCRNKLRHRHCEPTGRANARPMTGSAKQSISPRKERMDCFVASLLAMTSNSNTTPHSRGARRPSFARQCPSIIEGAGNAGCPLHPQPLFELREQVTPLARTVRHPAQAGYPVRRGLSI